MQIITRTSTETTFSIDKEIKIKIDSETRFCVSSSNYFAVSLSNSIAIFKNYLKITEIQNIKAIELQFSSSGDFICSFERFVSSDKMHRNLKVFDSNSGLEICSFSHKNQANWLFYWNINDSYFARQSLNEIHFYNAPFKDISSRIIVDNLSSFSISSSSIVAAFCAEKGGLPGSIQLYDLNSKLISRKTIFKGDSATFQWNAVGTAVLVITQTEVDKSGKSYYGETLLYYMSVDGNEGLLVNLDKPGPVHDISWSPNSTEFMVVYGTMPSKSTLFDHRANQIYNFPSAARNFCRFNPNSRIICIAGFGNLNGEIVFENNLGFMGS